MWKGTDKVGGQNNLFRQLSVLCFHIFALPLNQMADRSPTNSNKVIDLVDSSPAPSAKSLTSPLCIARARTTNMLEQGKKSPIKVTKVTCSKQAYAIRKFVDDSDCSSSATDPEDDNLLVTPNVPTPAQRIVHPKTGAVYEMLLARCTNVRRRRNWIGMGGQYRQPNTTSSWHPTKHLLCFLVLSWRRDGPVFIRYQWGRICQGWVLRENCWREKRVNNCHNCLYGFSERY